MTTVACEPFEAQLWHGTDRPRQLLEQPLHCGGRWAESESRLGTYLTSERDECFNYGHTPVAVTVRFERPLTVSLKSFLVDHDPTWDVFEAVGLDPEHPADTPPGSVLAALGYDGVVIRLSNGTLWAVPLRPETATVDAAADCRLGDIDKVLQPLWSGEDREALTAACDERTRLLEEVAFTPYDGWVAWRARWRADEY